jgi:hypothetical protein
MPPNDIGKLVRDIGVPSVIALGLVWFLSGQVLSGIEEHDEETRESLMQLIGISRQICINTATSERHRSACVADLLE